MARTLPGPARRRHGRRHARRIRGYDPDDLPGGHLRRSDRPGARSGRMRPAIRGAAAARAGEGARCARCRGRRFVTAFRPWSSAADDTRLRRPTDILLLIGTTLLAIGDRRHAAGAAARGRDRTRAPPPSATSSRGSADTVYGLVAVWAVVLLLLPLFSRGRRRLILDYVLGAAITLFAGLLVSRPSEGGWQDTLQSILTADPQPVDVVGPLAIATVDRRHRVTAPHAAAALDRPPARAPRCGRRGRARRHPRARRPHPDHRRRPRRLADPPAARHPVGPPHRRRRPGLAPRRRRRARRARPRDPPAARRLAVRRHDAGRVASSSSPSTAATRGTTSSSARSGPR